MAPLIETFHAAESSTPIQKFYSGETIFITGGTGFLGRLLLEKLLRSCPNISRIYLLIRQKKGKNCETRLNELFDDEIFNCLRVEQPKFRDKVRGIFGDCSEPMLDLSDESLQTIIGEVTLVFHCAATVNFDEKLKMATFINIRGTRDMVEICRRMKNLKFFTHVSTAYAHCVRFHLAEEFYEPSYTPEQAIALAENLPSETLDKLTETLLDQYPNTYVFTKTVSEDVLRQCKDLPVAVFRPAIIVSTYQEPVPGWINNFYGPQGVSTGAMIGLLRSLHCDENVNSNIVPVDMCVNALIAIPWEGRQKYESVKTANETAGSDVQEKYEIPVYQYESNTYNPISWKRFQYLTHLYGQNYPSMKAIGLYHLNLRKSLISHTIAIMFLHFLPAILLDFSLTCIGKKKMLYKAYQKIHKFSVVISYFATHNWIFESKNVETLCENMAPEDKKLFFCDLKQLDWNRFFQTYLRGCRIYLLKDPEHTLEKAKKNHERLKIYTVLAFCVLFCVVGFLFKALYSLF